MSFWSTNVSRELSSNNQRFVVTKREGREVYYGTRYLEEDLGE